MSDLQPLESSSPSGATPPPLPHKVLLFKIGWRLGFWLGVMQMFFLLLLFVLYFISPGGPPPLGAIVAILGVTLQTFVAHLISKHFASRRTLFTFSTACVIISYLPSGYFPLGLLNVVPLLFIMASSTPDSAPKAQENDPLETIDMSSSTESSPTKEDLY